MNMLLKEMVALKRAIGVIRLKRWRQLNAAPEDPCKCPRRCYLVDQEDQVSVVGIPVW